MTKFLDWLVSPGLKDYSSYTYDLSAQWSIVYLNLGELINESLEVPHKGKNCSRIGFSL